MLNAIGTENHFFKIMVTSKLQQKTVKKDKIFFKRIF